jgi:dsRNA-specific ribonuclease
MINSLEIEIYEPSKILGDVFEAIIGAIFIDGGIEKVIEVY